LDAEEEDDEDDGSDFGEAELGAVAEPEESGSEEEVQEEEEEVSSENEEDGMMGGGKGKARDNGRKVKKQNGEFDEDGRMVTDLELTAAPTGQGESIVIVHASQV